MADVEALMIASRDYHTHDHCSFAHAGGHFAQSGNFPSHCVHGTAGSKFLSEIAGALESAMITHGPERVCVCFKAMHEQVDSFSLAYAKV